MASKKLKMHKLVGKLQSFIPNVNDGKFPTANQLNKIFSKHNVFKIVIEDPTYFNLYPYLVQKDEAKSICRAIKSKAQSRWHIGSKIQVVYSIGDADVHWLKNGQIVGEKPKKKVTKSAKASEASAKASNKASAKSQSASYSFVASIKNSMQIDKANFSASARFAIRSHDKTASQLSTESRQFVSSEASEAKSLLASRADSSISSSNEHQMNNLDHPDDMFQAPGMMQGGFMAGVSSPTDVSSASSASTSASSVSASKSASQSASLSASQSASASKASSASESASLSQSVSALSAKSKAVKRSKSASKASVAKSQKASSKASSVSASRAKASSAKAHSESMSKASSASSVASSKSASKAKSASASESKASSASASMSASASASAKSASASSAKSLEAKQAKAVKESNAKLKRAEELKKKNQAPDTISTVKTFLHNHKLHHEKNQNDRVMQAYDKLLKHTNNNTTHWDRAGLNKIYKMEGWNGFFKKNEKDAVTRINASIDKILTNPAVTYPLAYDTLPDIHKIQQMAKEGTTPKSKREQESRSDNHSHSKGLFASTMPSEDESAANDSNSGNNNQKSSKIDNARKRPSKISRLRAERHSSGGFNYKAFIGKDHKDTFGSKSNSVTGKASSASSKPKSSAKPKKMPHTLTPYK